MTLRDRLLRCLPLLLLFHLAAFAGASAAAGQPTLDAKVREAFLFAFPVYQMARTRSEAIANARRDNRSIINNFGHRRRLSGPEDRLVTTPNNDTLYSAAWLDLSRGPVVLTIPALPDRYHSVALLDPFTDNVAVLGTRDRIGGPRRFLLSGPGWKGRVPPGHRHVALPANDIWAIVRVLVDGPADLPAAVRAQEAFTITGPLLPSEPPATWPRDPEARSLLAGANLMLGRAPLRADRRARARSLAAYGITPGRDAWARLSPAVRASWQRQLPGLMRELRAGFAATGTVTNGWSCPRRGMGRFGNDDFFRSAVALGGLAALPADEAVYLTAMRDGLGMELDGRRRYSLVVPANLPRSHFWSLSMYELAPDGRLFFTPNSIARYAMGDRTAGLRREPDGSLRIHISAERPSDPRANWLPAPAGPFRLTFRAYLPQLPSGEHCLVLPPVSPLP